MLTAYAVLTVASGLGALIGLALCSLVGMALIHQGSFDGAAVQDVVASQCSASSGALTTGAVFPQGALTGSQDVVYVNTSTTPGILTTRSAAQLIADLQQQLGFIPQIGYTWFITLVNQGTSTLTLAGGTGVTLGTGTNTVAGPGNRTYYAQITALGNSPAITIQTYGSGSA